MMCDQPTKHRTAPCRQPMLKWVLTALVLAVTVLVMVLGARSAHAAGPLPVSGSWVTPERLADLLPVDDLPPGSQVHVSLVKEDKRLGAEACPAPLLANTTQQKLWGRTFLRVSCVGTDTPGFFVAVDFRVTAPVLVVKKPVSQGQPVTADDVQVQAMDLTTLKGGWVSELAHLNQKTATRSLNPGLVLRPDLLKGQALIRQGDTVKVLIQGSGFSIGGQAVALEEAELGQTLRIRMPQGKVIQAVVKDAMVVELLI